MLTRVLAASRYAAPAGPAAGASPLATTTTVLATTTTTAATSVAAVAGGVSCVGGQSWVVSAGSSSSRGYATIGVRAEDKNMWERRAPLAPSNIEPLLNAGVNVVVEPSTLRVFPDSAYAAAGATLSSDLSDCDLILGVKEVPAAKLLNDKSYMFFAHVIKGQPHNMSLLDSLLAKNIRLIDYERMVNEAGERVVKFGPYAGYAGMIDFIHILGIRLLGLRYSTPLLGVAQTYTYPSLEHAKRAVAEAGDAIAAHGLPGPFSPFVVAFNGNGAVSKGAQSILKLLPHEFVAPDALAGLVANPPADASRKIYATIVNEEDALVRKDGGAFDKADYYVNPNNYASVYSSKILPYTSVVVNGTYWEEKYPKLVRDKDVAKLIADKTSRLVGVADISADIEGSVELTKKYTTIDDPFIVVDPATGKYTEKITDPGVVLMSIENLPSELAREATLEFGTALSPFLAQTAASDARATFDPSSNDLPYAVSKAVITSNGSLTRDYRYINKIRAAAAKAKASSAKPAAPATPSAKKDKSVLLLGSGRVARPLVDYFDNAGDVTLTVGALLKNEAEKLARGRTNVLTRTVDVSSPSSYVDLIREADVVVSLVPQPFHPSIAKACIEQGTDFVSASYTSTEMAALHDAASAKGIRLLNEMGLDPGIDHMLAQREIDRVHSAGGSVNSFVSWCGGLPAPEDSANPLGYKFSWSPRGVLTASQAPAQFLANGSVVHVEGKDLLSSAVALPLFAGFALEGYPNRDSTKYTEAYGLDPETASTVFRGTLRYRGFSQVAHALGRAGLMKDVPHSSLAKNSLVPLQELLAIALDVDPATPANELGDLVLERCAVDAQSPQAARILNAFQWLGFFSDKEVECHGTVVDTVSEHLAAVMSYTKDERDVIILSHEFQESLPEVGDQVKTISLVAYGTPGGDSAMAKTVSLPAAIGARLLLDGAVKATGVIKPMNPDVYGRTLDELAKFGVVARERVLPPGSATSPLPCQ